MAALFTTPGAITIFVRFRGESTPAFLGTCEVSPEVDGENVFLPVLNDLRGRSKPAQKVFDGSAESVTCTLNRVDELVWRRCKNPVDHVSATNSLGIDGRYEVGRLVMGICDFELFTINDFFGQTFPGAPVRQGRRYYSAEVGPYREFCSGGNRVQMVQVRFDCDGLFNPATRTAPVYTEDLSGITFTAN